MAKFLFEPLKLEHVSLLYHWFNDELEVNRWYAVNRRWSWQDIEKRYLPRLQPIPQENIPSFIVRYNQTMIGFIQYYSLADFFPDGIDSHDHKLFEKLKPSEIGGVDMFNLASASEVYGKGAGGAILKEFLEIHVKPLFKMIVLDPAKDNARAIRCYEKCGFKYFSTAQKEDHAEVYLMYLMSDKITEIFP